MQYDIEKKDQIYRKRHDFIEKLGAQNKGLRETIISMIEELSVAHKLVKATKERIVDLEKIATMLHKDLSSA